MKHEKLGTALCSGLLSFVIGWGTLGCLITAFDLPVAESGQLTLICIAGAVLCAGVLSVNWGGAVLAGLMALAAGYLYREGTALEQFQLLLHRLTSVYSRAYGWGVAELPETVTETAVDLPLLILGSLIIIVVSNSISCRRSALLPSALTVLILSACVVVTDTVPAEGWLLLVLSGLILLILTSSVRRENPDQGLRLTFGAAIPVAVALTALFLTNPQESYVNRSAVFRENILLAVEKFPQLMEQGVTEIARRIQPEAPKQVDLSSLGERINFTYPVMEVTAETSGILYLREQDFDTYDGRKWHAAPDRTEAFPSPGTEPAALTIRTENRKNYCFLPYYPGTESTLTGGSAENPEKAREYTLMQSPLPDDWRQRAYQGSGDSGSFPEYCMLPEATRAEAAGYLEGLFSSHASNTEKADSIAAFVTNSAVYDLVPDKMPEGEADFALWFLREGDRGYCVHFATVATVLLRAADIPARYVTGYLLESRAGEPVTVTEENAHAWAEYYEPSLGLWLVLETTPAEEEPEVTPLPPAVPETISPVETQTEPTETVTEATLPETTIPEDAPTGPDVPPEVPELPESEKIAVPLWPLWLLLIPAVLAGQRYGRLKWRRWQFRRGSPNRQALRRWREAERLSRIRKECPPPELQELAQKAKFSQYELTEEELSRFDEHIGSTVRRMRRSLWWQQLLYRFVYAAY